jgi:hypothetical protein
MVLQHFKGVKYKIIVLMKIEQMPYFIGIYYMAHKTNLTI